MRYPAPKATKTGSKRSRKTRIPSISIKKNPSKPTTNASGYEVKVSPSDNPLAPVLYDCSLALKNRARRNEILSDPRLTVSGVYYMMDAQNRVLYTGSSADKAEGLAARLKRHVAFSKTDVMAQGRVTVPEVSYLTVIPMPGTSSTDLAAVERSMIQHFKAKGHPIMQSSPEKSSNTPINWDEQITFQLVCEETMRIRTTKNHELRLHIRMLDRALDQIEVNPTSNADETFRTRLGLLNAASNG